MVPSPVVQLNRAVAVAMADGPAAGLELVGAIEASGALSGYHLLPATRADLLRRLGRHGAAARSYREALALASTDAERRYLARRLADAERREPGLKAPLGREPGPGRPGPGAGGGPSLAGGGHAGLAGGRRAGLAFPDMLGGDGFDHDRMHNVLLVPRIAFWFGADLLRSWTGRGR